MNVWVIFLVIAAMIGVAWAYTRVPAPWNYVIAGVVAVVCIIVLLNLAGIGTGLHT